MIGTPGRVKALIEQRVLQCHALRLLVFDEVDKLMQSDFEREVPVENASWVCLCASSLAYHLFDKPNDVCRFSTLLLHYQSDDRYVR